MADRQFLRLNDRWALAYDPAQWIVQKRRGTEWRGVCFVGSNKDILWRVFEEKGIDVTPEARAYIDAMPHRFLDWIAIPPERRFKVSDSAILGVVVGRTTPAPERSRDRAKKAA